jgi:hypothetical protein
MLRYRLTAYYEDKATEVHVAQTVIVIAEDDKEAVRSATADVARDAAGGRVAAIQVLEKAPIKPGVVYRSDPYIPFRWPATPAPAKAQGS